MALGQLPEADLDGEEDSIFAEINITPLTDIFLVMLIIFMVAAAAALQEREQQLESQQQQTEQIQKEIAAEKRAGLQVNLPSGSSQEIDPAGKSLIVAIAKSGQIAVNDEPIDPKLLDNVFQSAFQMDKNTQVVIKADKGVDHGTVVGVMQRAKAVGLQRLAIQTAGK